MQHHRSRCLLIPIGLEAYHQGAVLALLTAQTSRKCLPDLLKTSLFSVETGQYDDLTFSRLGLQINFCSNLGLVFKFIM